MAMVVSSSSRIPSSLQRQSTLVARWKGSPIWSVNVPAVERTTHNSKTADSWSLATELGRKNAFFTTRRDGSESASMGSSSSSSFCSTTSSRLRVTSGRRRHNRISPPRAEKRNEDGCMDDDSSNSSFLSMELLLQMAIIVLTIGFIDAGYSGDWSRIGALSKEKEELLRTAAYGVVPLSAAAVWAIGNQRKSGM